MTETVSKKTPVRHSSPMCECANCHKRWRQDNLDIPRSVWNRIDPGSTVPAGECPSCGALAYLDELPEWLLVYHYEGQDPDFFRYAAKQQRSEDVIKRWLGKQDNGQPAGNYHIDIHVQLHNKALPAKEVFK